MFYSQLLILVVVSALAFVETSASPCGAAITAYKNDFTCNNCIPEPFDLPTTGIIPPRCTEDEFGSNCTLTCQNLIDDVVSDCASTNFTTDPNVGTHTSINNVILAMVEPGQVGACELPITFTSCDKTLISYKNYLGFNSFTCGKFAGDDPCSGACKNVIDDVFIDCEDKTWVVLNDDETVERGEIKSWSATDVGFNDLYWDDLSNNCKLYVAALVVTGGPDNNPDDKSDLIPIIGGVVGGLVAAIAAFIVFRSRSQAKTLPTAVPMEAEVKM
uniref:Uncharacterized protein n=1 Tax=Aplanochytrium stocchinoi TaxID=215587 RepID=A0A7S3PKU1_9STRA|mmetsp:Transcript_14779/g.18274  ORF Transcript_14779/g.18274 Transcript_14779/m.18274 type:complete len:273 (-) Transcript_14779:145-963(-)